MKVMNGLVHGDTRSHVILSPGVVGATANHTVECLSILINTVFEEHGCLPPLLTLQFDGASVNKCILVLAFMALYVLYRVFTTARARCELENHAHDVYDAFQAVHAIQVRAKTFYHFEDLRSIIKAAHLIGNDAHALRPVAGHDVQVSNLWTVRDYWEWLCPGYTKETTRKHAMANAAFASYPGLHKFRDFKMELEEGSTPENGRVGLWAKVYMTSPEYTYLGTILTTASVQAVIRGQPPPMQDRDVSDSKQTRENKVVTQMRSLSRGKLSSQFSADRLADAIAICERRWDHFKGCDGELSASALLLPHELAAKVQKKRAQTAQQSQQSLQSEREVASALVDASATRFPAGVQQRHHAGADLYGFRHGNEIPVAPATQQRAPSDREFATRLVTPGCFVLTRPAASSHWARCSPKLAKLDFWMWQVSKVYLPGQTPPGASNPVSDYTYVAQLFQPKGKATSSKWIPTWEVTEPKYMRTEMEKAARQTRKDHKNIKVRMKPCHAKGVKSAQSGLSSKMSVRSKLSQKNQMPAAKSSFTTIVKSWDKAARQRLGDAECAEEPSSGVGAKALQSLLRPGNIVGGGFGRTPSGCVPRFVQGYWERRGAVTA